MKGYSWLADGLIPGQSGLIEALWAYGWLTFALAPLTIEQASPLSFPWVVALLVLPAVAGRYLDYVFRLRPASRWLLAAIVLALFTAFMKTQTLPNRSLLDWRWLVDVLFPWTSIESASRGAAVSFGWLAGICLLGRGTALALNEIDEDSATAWFLGGLGAFVVLLLGVLLSRTPSATEESQLLAMLAAYFCLGLTWQALVKRQQVAQQAFGRASNTPAMSWLGVFATVSLSILGLAVVVTGFGAQIARALGQLAAWLFELLLPVLLFIWAVVVFVLSRLPRLKLAPAANAQQPTDDELRQILEQMQRLAALLRTLPIPPHIAQWLLFLGVVALFSLLLHVIRRRRRLWTTTTEERTSLWSWRAFMADVQHLAAAPRRVRLRLPRPYGGTLRHAPARKPSSIRALYRAVLRWCRERGHARQPAATPREFAPSLRGLIPPDLERELTASYILARYGLEDAPEPDVARLIRSWEAFRRATPEEGDSERLAAPGRLEPSPPKAGFTPFRWKAEVLESAVRVRGLHLPDSGRGLFIITALVLIAIVLVALVLAALQVKG
ncbi:MAG: DUF4129 domain-containing protein [Chloroflexota bacterium]|nr:DUF4129 domain-containing protein [Chloroflexota bacterium]